MEIQFNTLLRKDFPNTLRNPEYLNARLEDLYFSQEQGSDFALKKYNLDAILFPSYIGSTICAKAGDPSIAVPAGYLKNGRPFGNTFASIGFSEGTLIKLVYAFEQATKSIEEAPICRKYSSKRIEDTLSFLYAVKFHMLNKQ